MKPIVLEKQGIQFRAIKCIKCNNQIIHPSDKSSLENFKDLKGKTYNVKLRVVGNSHAISIPKEIVNFIKHQEKMFNDFDDIVRLCFEDMNKLSLRFRRFDKERY